MPSHSSLCPAKILTRDLRNGHLACLPAVWHSSWSTCHRTTFGVIRIPCSEQKNRSYTVPMIRTKEHHRMSPVSVEAAPSKVTCRRNRYGAVRLEPFDKQYRDDWGSTRR